MKKVKENRLKDINAEDYKKVEQKSGIVKKSFYFGYNFRIAFFIALSLICIISGIKIISGCIYSQEEEKITYSEQGSLKDYKVYLKDNNFYEDKEYLPSGMAYVASLIDKIELNFIYGFATSTPLKGTYDYRILATLEIYDLTSNDPYLTKNYVIMDTKTAEFDSKSYGIDETVSIDYYMYNIIADSFKESYGLTTGSDLKVYLEVDRKLDDSSLVGTALNVKEKVVSTATIPLSEKSVKITLNSSNVNNADYVTTESGLSISNRTQLIVGIGLIAIAILFIFIAIKYLTLFRKKDTDYDRRLKRIMNEYDRLIVNTKNMPDLTKYEITKVENFEELIDARDNLRRPINFYEVAPHHKSNFFVKNDNELYLFVLKEIDITDNKFEFR